MARRLSLVLLLLAGCLMLPSAQAQDDDRLFILEIPGYGALRADRLAARLETESAYRVEDLVIYDTPVAALLSYHDKTTIYRKFRFNATRGSQVIPMVCKLWVDLDVTRPDDYQRVQTYDCLEAGWHTLLHGESFMMSIPFADLGLQDSNAAPPFSF